MKNDSGSSSLVRVNVGGKKFCTHVSTLTQHEPNSMLAAMFSTGCHALCQDEKGYIFIDRDGEYFTYILNWLRDGVVPTLEDSKYSQLLKEAQYFQLEGLIDGIHLLLNNKKETELGTDLTRGDIIKYILYVKSREAHWPRFRGVNLCGLDLSGLELSEIDFSYACIRNVCFANANRLDSNFEHVDAEGANFTNATLGITSFKKANLRGANFTNVKLGITSFKEANLRGANFNNASFENSCFKKANLRGAHFNKANLGSSSFIDADLRGANFNNANLESCSFVAADLQGPLVAGVEYA